MQSSTITVRGETYTAVALSDAYVKMNKDITRLENRRYAVLIAGYILVSVLAVLAVTNVLDRAAAVLVASIALLLLQVVITKVFKPAIRRQMADRYRERNAFYKEAIPALRLYFLETARVRLNNGALLGILERKFSLMAVRPTGVYREIKYSVDGFADDTEYLSARYEAEDIYLDKAEAPYDIVMIKRQVDMDIDHEVKRIQNNKNEAEADIRKYQDHAFRGVQ